VVSEIIITMIPRIITIWLRDSQLIDDPLGFAVGLGEGWETAGKLKA
jgi:hypothetical protein